MIWDSWADFFKMGGYGLYVWGSVVMSFGLMAAELLGLSMRWNNAYRQARLRAHGDDAAHMGQGASS